MTFSDLKLGGLAALIALAGCSETLAKPQRGGPPPVKMRMSSANAVCEKSVDPTIIRYGYNRVVDAAGTEVKPQGRPIQEGYQLVATNKKVSDHNTREYARIFAYMGQIREALMCGADNVSQSEWDSLTAILDLNGIKITQNLSGTPKEQYYSSDGIYKHLKTGADFHPMMKYLEEAELELKCLAFTNFNFVNPEGVNHCTLHGLAEGSGLKLP